MTWQPNPVSVTSSLSTSERKRNRQLNHWWKHLAIVFTSRYRKKKPLSFMLVTILVYYDRDNKNLTVQRLEGSFKYTCGFQNTVTSTRNRDLWPSLSSWTHFNSCLQPWPWSGALITIFRVLQYMRIKCLEIFLRLHLKLSHSPFYLNIVLFVTPRWCEGYWLM